MQCWSLARVIPVLKAWIPPRGLSDWFLKVTDWLFFWRVTLTPVSLSIGMARVLFVCQIGVIASNVVVNLGPLPRP